MERNASKGCLTVEGNFETASGGGGGGGGGRRILQECSGCSNNPASSKQAQCTRECCSSFHSSWQHGSALKF